MTETCILTDGSQLIRDRVGSDWPMRSRQADFGQFCVTLIDGSQMEGAGWGEGQIGQCEAEQADYSRFELDGCV